jgi:hypothetical protein
LNDILPFKTHGPVISYFRVCHSTSHLLYVATSSCVITKSLRLAKFGCFYSDLYCFTARKVSNPKLRLNLCHRDIKRIQIISVFYILTFRGWTVRAYFRNCQVRPLVCNIATQSGSRRRPPLQLSG